MAHDWFRTVRFTPYSKGNGPSFTLRLAWGGRCDSAGRCILTYRLTSERRVIFEGSDYCAHVRDSLETDDSLVEGIMTFLTLRPGDTDEEYFRDYTPEQLAFCDAHAETLHCEMGARFQCPECGNVLRKGHCSSHGSAKALRARMNAA
jgi:predicted RNA-binding Zn-ribbon protein involved in translation (DUF1610 family)